MGSEMGDFIDTDSFASDMYVLWCCSSICHQIFTFIQIGSGHTTVYYLQNYYWRNIMTSCVPLHLLLMLFFYFSFSGIKRKNCFRICWKSKRRRIGTSICFDQRYLCQQCQWCFWQIWSLSKKEHFYYSKQHSASWRPITFAVFEYFWKNLFYISFIQFTILRSLIISHFAYQFITFIFKSNIELGPKAELLLLKLIHLFTREVLLVKKLEIEQTKTT